MQSISTPLLFEPGTGWSYGSSSNWAGILVARLNNMSLEAYMQKYIWDPLGIQNITFHLELKPEVRKNLVTMTRRGTQETLTLAKPSDEKVTWTDETLYDDPTADEWGAGGTIGSAVDYIKILHSICTDDGRLLKSETIDEMFTPQLPEEAQKRFAGIMRLMSASLACDQSNSVQFGHGLAGALTLNDGPTGAKTGTLSWGGFANMLWSIDRESGLSLMYATNIVPPNDSKTNEMKQLFSKEMYNRISTTAS